MGNKDINFKEQGCCKGQCLRGTKTICGNVKFKNTFWFGEGGHGNKLNNSRGTFSFILGNKGQVPPHPERTVSMFEQKDPCYSERAILDFFVIRACFTRRTQLNILNNEIMRAFMNVYFNIKDERPIDKTDGTIIRIIFRSVF